jgi:hypothetical protein
MRVAPFKAQNMALNSAVTADGGEIGRAQALQARAARVAPHTDMNPVLLKPSSATAAQVIVHGRVRADMNARDVARPASRAVRGRRRRGRRQPGGDQPARPRHRQHGIRRGGRLPGDPRRRHRPGRRLREESLDRIADAAAPLLEALMRLSSRSASR